MHNFFDRFIKLYDEGKHLRLLGAFYATVTVVMVFVAGLCALVNRDFGLKVLIIPQITLSALVMNIAVWAVLKLAVEAIKDRREYEAYMLERTLRPQSAKTAGTRGTTGTAKTPRTARASKTTSATKASTAKTTTRKSA